MQAQHAFLRSLLLTSSALFGAFATSTFAADVTPERLTNPDKEPQNWLMNHRSYDGQRFSPLDMINKGNVKGLKLAYAIALGGGAGNEFTVATPLAEDGFLYVTEFLGRALQDRRHFRRRRPHRVAHGSRTAAPAAQPRRRAVGQSRDHRRRHRAADHRHRQGDRQGGVGNDLHRYPRRDVHGGAARRQGQDHRRRRQWRPGRARLDRRGRCQDRQAAVAPIHHSGAGRARQRDLEGQHQCLADRRRRGVGHRNL